MKKYDTNETLLEKDEIPQALKNKGFNAEIDEKIENIPPKKKSKKILIKKIALITFLIIYILTIVRYNRISFVL